MISQLDKQFEREAFDLDRVLSMNLFSRGL